MATRYLSETVLEMHFHSSLMDLFRSTFGVGPTGKIEFFKYSPQLEKFVGFDQAYVRTELSEKALFNELKNAASKNNYVLNKKIYGYFLQFKVVSALNKKSKQTPAGFSIPYFRSDLSTQRKKRNDPSQHELLYQLSKNKGAMVYYACPMIFDRTEIYRSEADLEKLALVEVASAPSAFVDNARHTVCFQKSDGEPTWCSDPILGRAIPGRQFVGELTERMRSEDRVRENMVWLADFLQSRVAEEGRHSENMLQLIGEALTVVIATERIETNNP